MTGEKNLESEIVRVGQRLMELRCLQGQGVSGSRVRHQVEVLVLERELDDLYAQRRAGVAAVARKTAVELARARVRMETGTALRSVRL